MVLFTINNIVKYYKYRGVHSILTMLQDTTWKNKGGGKKRKQGKQNKSALYVILQVLLHKQLLIKYLNSLHINL